MPGLQDLPALGRGDLGGVHPHREDGGGLPHGHGPGPRAGAQGRAQVDAVDARGGKGPAHVLVGVGGQGGGVLAVAVPGVEAVGGGKAHLGGTEGGGQVGRGVPRPLHAGDAQVHLAGAVGAVPAAGAGHAHAQPHGLQGAVLHQGQDGGPLLGGLLGDGHRHGAPGEVGVQGADNGVLLQQEVVGEGQVGVGHVPHGTQAGLVGVGVGAVGHHLGDGGPVPGDIAHQVGEDAGGGHHPQLAVGSGVNTASQAAARHLPPRSDGHLSTRAPACPTNAIATRPLNQPRKGVRGVSWHGSGWWKCLSSSPGTNPSSFIQLFR